MRGQSVSSPEVAGSSVAYGYLGLRGGRGLRVCAILWARVDGGEASVDEEEVPVSPVFVRAGRWVPRVGLMQARVRGLYLHEGDEAVNFGFAWGELGEDAAEAEGFFAECGAHELVACGGGVALVEE